jgi:molecular chaperone GrpE
MATEESDQVKDPEVAEVLQKGYMLHNRLLRPSMVRVLMPRKG